jgi:hypothetical protein
MTFGELKQQPEGVAIRTDRMRTGLSLTHQALGKIPFKKRGEIGGFHDRTSQNRSNRFTADPISWGQAVKYQ